ncbi:MAG: hypothetical protein ACOC9R_01710 [bacterium]
MSRRSDRMSVAAPLSYTGSKQRLWNIGRDAHPALRWSVLVPLLVAAIILVWTVVTVWYMVFGLLLVPYRLIRRGSRKKKLDDRRHREMLDTIDRRP